MSERPKVFCIGLNKTGTSSMRTALQALGYRVCGPRRKLLEAFRRGDFSGFDEVVHAYDAFEDVPWPLVFEYLFDRYGDDTRFVLTTRASPERWLQSIENHALGSGLTTRTWLLTYGTLRPFGHRARYLAFYTQHIERVREFFARHNAEHRLLEMCLERGDGWRELCRFLGEPVPEAEFPHSNRTDLSRKRLNRAINSLVEPIYRGVVRWREAVASSPRD